MSFRINLDRLVTIPRERSWLLRVPAVVRNCVGYVYFRRGGKTVPAGTAWFIVIPEPNDAPSPQFTVTARHVIDAVREHSDDGIVRVAVNARGTGTRSFADSHVDDWVSHPADDAAAVEVEHDGAVEEPVEHGGGDGGVAEDLAPGADAAVGGDARSRSSGSAGRRLGTARRRLRRAAAGSRVRR